jgi:hypothetical protein
VVTPGGKLYNKFNNSKRKLVKDGLFPVNKYTAAFVEPGLTNTEASETAKTWLQLHHPPWGVLEEKWKASAKFRQADLQALKTMDDIIDAWPKYKTASGYLLV